MSRTRGLPLGGAVAVVTGASAGIGRATARALAARGATVVAAARREDRLAEVAGEIRERGGRALPVPCDVADRAQVEALRDRVLAEYGRCDVLVNNAGIPGGGRFADAPPDRIEQLVQTNLLGVLRGTKAFLPAMLEAGRGHVVNVASLAGRFAIPGSAVYAATKHGVVAFSEALHYEVAPAGVLVTSVNPGFVTTERFRHDGLARLGVPVMRPEDVARLLVRVISRGIAPEISIPRWLSAFQAARVLAPGPYRLALGAIARRGAPLTARARGPETPSA